MQTPTGTLRVDVKRIALTRNQLPINRFGTGQSISRIRCIKGLEELLGDDAPQVDILLRDYIHAGIELVPNMDNGTLFNLLKHFAVTNDELVSEELFHAVMDFRSTGEGKNPIRKEAYWSLAREFRGERMTFYFNVWRKPSTEKTSLYATHSLFTKTIPEKCIFLNAFQDLSKIPIFGFRHMAGHGPVLKKDYNGPFLEVINMWYTAIRIVIAKMDVLRCKIDDAFGKGIFNFDEYTVTTLALSVLNLPEDLSAWMYDIFEAPIQQFEKDHHGECEDYIQQVRDANNELSTAFLQHEIQAIWACFYNDKNFMPLDVFYNHEERPFPLHEVLERWSPLKIATVYYIGILSTKYSDLHFTADNVMSLFVASKSSEPNDYATFEGSLLPSFDFITNLAIEHRTKAFVTATSVAGDTSVNANHKNMTLFRKLMTFSSISLNKATPIVKKGQAMNAAWAKKGDENRELKSLLPMPSFSNNVTKNRRSPAESTPLTGSTLSTVSSTSITAGAGSSRQRGKTRPIQIGSSELQADESDLSDDGAQHTQKNKRSIHEVSTTLTDPTSSNKTASSAFKL